MHPPHPASNDTPAGPLYRAVWRWHFDAGTVVAPLAITGAIYLWKPQYAVWRYHRLLTVAPGSATVFAGPPVAARQRGSAAARAVVFAQLPAVGSSALASHLVRTLMKPDTASTAKSRRLMNKGPFTGLWLRTAGILMSAGYRTRAEVRTDLKSGRLTPAHSGVRGYGPVAHEEVRAWLDRSRRARSTAAISSSQGRRSS